MTLILSGTDGLSDVDGSAATPAIRGTDANTGIFFPAADTIAFSEGGVEAMRLDSAGNMGLGVTPSASTTAGTIYFPSNTTFGRYGYTQNSYFNGTNYIYSSSSQASLYQASSGQHIFYTAASGTAGNTVSFTQAMTLDASGNLGVGITSPVSPLTAARGNVTGAGQWASSAIAVYNPTNTGSYSQISFGYTTGTTNAAAYIGYVSTNQGTNGYGDLVFGTRAVNTDTQPTERARINSSGYFKASNNGAYKNASAAYHELKQSATDTNIAILTSSAASPYGPNILFDSATPNNTTNYFLLCEDSTNSKAIIFSSGTISNRTGTYNSISDLKLKQDITDASSQWSDIKSLRIVKYRLKDEVAADPNYPSYIGVIAQEAEKVSPGLIDNCPDFETVEVEDEDGNVTTERRATGTVTKSVKTSIIYMKAVKALQEAMTRIEALETEMQSLKGTP